MSSGRQLLISFEVTTGAGRPDDASEPAQGDAAPPPGRTTDVPEAHYRAAERPRQAEHDAGARARPSDEA